MRLFYVLGCFCVGLASCKITGPMSTTKGLDALGGEKTEAVCSASPSQEFNDRYSSFWSQSSIIGDGNYQNNLRSVFAAVPLELQSWFFLKGGKFQLIGNAQQFCTSMDATNLYRRDGSIGGCLSIPKATGLTSMPSMYIEISARDYKSQMEQASILVQGFAALTSSFVTEIALADRLSNNNELLYEYGANDAAMKNLKVSLAFMVIEDLLNSKDSSGKSYAESLPQEIKSMLSSSKVLNASMDRSTRWQGFWAASGEQGHREFTQFAVAQTLDSAWCNDATRGQLFAEGALFKRTGSFFKREFEPVLSEAFSGTPQQVSTNLTGSPAVATSANALTPAMPTAESGLNLSDTAAFPILGAVVRAPFAVNAYFAANRPVRSWFANYQPVRRVLWGTGQTVTGVARGAAIVSGRVAGGVSRIMDAGAARVGYRVQNGCFIRRWRC
jgi:hypothetical protein